MKGPRMAVVHGGAGGGADYAELAASGIPLQNAPEGLKLGDKASSSQREAHRQTHTGKQAGLAGLG